MQPITGADHIYFTLILYWESRDIFYIFGNQSQKLVPDYLIQNGAFYLLWEKPVQKPTFFPPQVFVAWQLSKTSYIFTCSKSNLSYLELGFVGILVCLLVLDWVGFFEVQIPEAVLSQSRFLGVCCYFHVHIILDYWNFDLWIILITNNYV